MTQKNICFLINSLGGGGAERVVQILANYYSSLGHKVTIVLTMSQDQVYSVSEKVKIISLKESNNRFISFIKKMYELNKVFRENNFDYKYSFLFKSNILNILASYFSGKRPIVISERSFSIENYKNNKILITFLKYFYSKADRIIAISEGVKKSLIKDFNLRCEIITVINNPIILPENVIPKDIKSKKTKLISVGRLVESKNQKFLVKVIKELKSKDFDCELTIIGEGPLREKLLLLIQKNNLMDNINLIGYVNNPSEFLKESDIFVFSSKYEAFGNVIIEAMANGLPVVSLESKGGPKEILKGNQFGISISEACPMIMANAIIDLSKKHDNYKRYSELSIERASHFRVEKISQEYIDVFSDL